MYDVDDHHYAPRTPVIANTLLLRLLTASVLLAGAMSHTA